MKTWTEGDTVYAAVKGKTFAVFKERAGGELIYIVARVGKGKKLLRIAEVFTPFDALEVVKRAAC